MKYLRSVIAIFTALTLLCSCGGAESSSDIEEHESKRSKTTEGQHIREENTEAEERGAPTYSKEETYEVTESVQLSENLIFEAPKTIDGSVTDTSINILWDPVRGADAYRIYSYEPAINDFMAFLEVTEPSFSVSGLTPGGTYYFKI